MSLGDRLQKVIALSQSSQEIYLTLNSKCIFHFFLSVNMWKIVVYRYRLSYMKPTQKPQQYSKIQYTECFEISKLVPIYLPIYRSAITLKICTYFSWIEHPLLRQPSITTLPSFKKFTYFYRLMSFVEHPVYRCICILIMGKKYVFGVCTSELQVVHTSCCRAVINIPFVRKMRVTTLVM